MSTAQRAGSTGRGRWGSRAATSGALTCLVLAGCIDLGIDLDFEAHLDSLLLDLGTWSAAPCGDLDGDGVSDVVVFADGQALPSTAWVVSSRDLQVKCRVEGAGPGPASALPPLSTVSPDVPVAWRVVELEPDPSGGMRAKWEIDASSSPVASPGVDEMPAPTSPMRLNAYVLEAGDSSSWRLVDWGDPPSGDAAPSTELNLCGDLDADGVLDSMTLCDKPPRVKIVSGRDNSLLREISLGNARFVTAATGSCDVGDVDGDLIADLLVGAQVSTSDKRLSPRRCELGLLSIVSGADGSVLRSIDRETLLTSDVVRDSIRSR